MARKSESILFVIQLLAFLQPAISGDPVAQQNRMLVMRGMNEMFVNRDATAVDRYIGSTYIQHNPTAVNGRAALASLIRSFPGNFRYEAGMVVAEGDIVMAHGRYTGFGPTPQVAVDIFRVQDNRIVEHWDILQDEVPTAQTASGNPMFTIPQRG